MPCKCSALWGEAEGIPLGLMSFFLVGIQGESLSLPKEHHLQACDLDVLSGCLVLGREPGASSSSLVACLDLPKLFVCLYLLVCEMGLILITAMEGRTHRFVWIPKFTFKKHFEDVKLSPKAWRCCKCVWQEVLLSYISGWPVNTGLLKASDSGAECWASACTSPVLDHVFFFSEEVMTCLRSHPKTSVGSSALLLCPTDGKERVCMCAWAVTSVGSEMKQFQDSLSQERPITFFVFCLLLLSLTTSSFLEVW